MSCFDDVRNAVRQAKATMSAVKLNQEDMVALIAGNLKLKEASWQYYEDLATMKRELKNFNLKTKRWMK